jgi:hypothetical protein
MRAAIVPEKATSTAETGEERRCETRHPYPCRRWIAPYNGWNPPKPDDFNLVQCRDISTRGISFYLDRQFECEMVVIRLPSADGPRYMTAQIRRVAPDAGGILIVGCQFVGTLHHDAALEALIRRREGA